LRKQDEMKNMMKIKKPPVLDSDAVFLGWQKTVSGEMIALYNISLAGHPSYGSTVTDRILHDLKLHIPKRYHRPGKIKNWKISPG
jgi:hypothetical protein